MQFNLVKTSKSTRYHTYNTTQTQRKPKFISTSTQSTPSPIPRPLINKQSKQGITCYEHMIAHGLRLGSKAAQRTASGESLRNLGRSIRVQGSRKVLYKFIAVPLDRNFVLNPNKVFLYILGTSNHTSKLVLPS